MMLTVEDVTQDIAAWALDYGIPTKLIRSRLKRGWSEERAVTEPMVVRPGEKLTPQAFTVQKTKVAPVRFKLKAKHRVFESRMITFNGESMTVAQWAARLGIRRHALDMRFWSGWPLERALTEPHGAPNSRKARPVRGRIITHDGRAMRIPEWAAHLGLRRGVLEYRLRQGLPLSEVLSPQHRRGKRQ